MKAYIFKNLFLSYFLQFCQKLKNYISLQLHIDRFTKHLEKKIGKRTFETTLVLFLIVHQDDDYNNYWLLYLYS